MRGVQVTYVFFEAVGFRRFSSFVYRRIFYLIYSATAADYTRPISDFITNVWLHSNVSVKLESR